MVEKDPKTTEKEKSVEKESKKEKDTLPIDTEESDERDKQELNNDDEFEEFPIYEHSVDENPVVIADPRDVNVWADNWEDETVEKDFSFQLSEKFDNKNILEPMI